MGTYLLMEQHDNGLRSFIDLLASNAEILDRDSRLRIIGDGTLETFYAPFEHINVAAQITLIGLTPGQTQMRIALNETRLALRSGLSWHEAIERAKYLASFGGPMRQNLTKMLDHIGLNGWLGIDTCDLLFSSHRSMAHYTSVLRYPVFNAGANYSGKPDIDRTPFLREQIDRWFAAELVSLRSSIFIPLGTQVQQVFMRVAREHGIFDERCLMGIPHPSGANAERIAYFLGRKQKDKLSPKTDSESIDLIRAKLISKVKALGG